MVSGRLPAAERRRQLLSVACSVLAQRGYHSTTMTDIADAAGVTKPVLYQHFDSKRDLYRTVLEDIGARLEAVIVESASAAPTPRDRAEAGIRAYAKFVEEDSDGFELLFSGTNRQDAEWALITSAVEQSLAHAVASMIDVPTISADRRQVLANGIIGMAESMMRYAKAEPDVDFSRDQLAEDITSLAWSGLRGLE